MLWEARIEAYIYTTGRHAPDRPRYRIVVLFWHTYEDTPNALRQLHAQMMARLNGALAASWRRRALRSRSPTTSAASTAWRSSSAARGVD